MRADLSAPFPRFGGKSRAASLIWEGIGDVAHYIEPFAGSLAVLLARPTQPRLETVNDLDCWIANFWRAVRADPDAVARYADHPISEVDVHARHDWLMGRHPELRGRLLNDPDAYDARTAGWWAWGASSWIGPGWCNANRGKSPRQIPALASSAGLARRGLGSQEILAWMRALAARLRGVRVCCGDWSRVVGESTIGIKGGSNPLPCGIVLDPPYEDGDDVYAEGNRATFAAAREWALAHGDHTQLRIALCGYEGGGSHAR